MQKDEAEIKEMPMFVGCECRRSFFIFDIDNEVRRFVYKLI